MSHYRLRCVTLQIIIIIIHNNLRLMMVNTNRSTLHTVYNIVCHAGQQWHEHTRLSLRTAATNRFSPVGIGCQKQTAPRFCQHPIRCAFTSQAFTRWRHLGTHPINSPAKHPINRCPSPKLSPLSRKFFSSFV